jgi:hypothetical protein
LGAAQQVIQGEGGETFAQPSVVPGSAEQAPAFSGSQQGLLMNKLAVNERGTIAIVNSTFQPNQGSRVRLIRGRIDER